MPPAQQGLFDACRTLFGEEINLNPEFIAYLQPSGAKAAYRSKAKQHHPDRFTGASQEVLASHTEKFREIHQAYHVLSSYLQQRHLARGSAHPAKPSRATSPAGSSPKRQPPRNSPTCARARGVPPMPMEFGLFAYYRGKIAYHDLIEALIWQRRQRPAIGILACQWRWLKEGDLRRIIVQPGLRGRFGERAVALGLLSPLQVDSLLRYQRSKQQRIGQFFIDRGLLTAEEVGRLVEELKRHNSGVGCCR